MKKIKNYIYIGVAATALASCTDSFLEEKMVATITQDYLNTEQGLDQLIVSTYNAERVSWGYSEGIYMFETGHDCARTSGNNDLNKFSTSKWSATGEIGTQTNYYMGCQSKQQDGFLINNYPIIDNCNKAIEAIRSEKATGKYASDPEYAAQRLSEALFNRAYCYYGMNTVLGDVYFSTQSRTSLPANYNYQRTPAEVMFKELIGDLRYAFEHLPESYGDAEYGRATKYAAAHLLAKMYLNRVQGQEYGTEAYGRKSDGTIDNSNPQSYLGMLYKGKGTNDLDSCIYYATQVINAHPLASNYDDLFRHELGDFSNEKTSENVLNAIFSESGDDYRYGVRIVMSFVGNVVDEKYGIPDYCWEYPTKPAFYFHNNDFGLDVFTDKVNDSRYQKSFWLEFKTALNTTGASTPGANADYYAYNSAENKTYVWTEAQANTFNNKYKADYTRESWGGRSAVAGEHKMGTGDLAYAILENTKETAINVEDADAQPYVLYARWMKDGNKYYYRPEIVKNGDNYTFKNTASFYGLEKSSNTGVPTSKKYHDPNRSGKNSFYGGRDVPVMRSAEMYLVRAEAYGCQGKYNEAIDDINALRQRAAFKAGENRAEVIARFADLYAGNHVLSSTESHYPYTVAADCYDKIKVDASYWDGTSAHSLAENYCPSANTNEKRFLEFIYNEYAREFNQEMIYYGVIHHAGVQAARIQWHNQLAANMQNATYQTGTWETSDNLLGTDGQNGQPKGGFQNYMTLKPFPQSFLDMLTDDNNVLLDNAGKKAYQNYGY